MNDLEKTIKHFESLQKRYTTEHNGKMCERVADALEALQLYERLTQHVEEVTYEAYGYNCRQILQPPLKNFASKNEADREFLENSRDMD